MKTGVNIMEYIFNLLSRISQDAIGLTISSIIFGILIYCLVSIIFRYWRQFNASTRYSILWSMLIVIVSFPFLVGILTSVDFSKFVANEPELKPLVVSIPDQNYSTPIANKLSVNHENVNLADVKSEVSLASTIQEIDYNMEKSWQDWYKLIPIILLLIWSVIVTILVLRLIVSYRSIKSLKSSAYPFDISSYKRVKDILRKNRFNRKIRIAISDKIEIPIAAGFRNPTVLIPDNLINKLSDNELEIVLIHEIIHLLRRDDWSNLIQQLIGSFNFFHPVVYWINSRLNLIREITCDESVIGFIGNPKKYAECLTKTLQLTIGSGTTLMSNAYTGDKQIFQRLKEILLWNNRNGSRFNGIKLTVTSLVVTILAVVFVKVSPVVAFSGSYLTYDELNSSINSLISSDKKSKIAEHIKEKQPQLQSTVISSGNKNTETEVAANNSLSNVEEQFETNNNLLIAKTSELSEKLSLLAEKKDSIVTDSKFTNYKLKGATKTINNELVTYTWNNGKNIISVQMKGDVEFSENVKSIKSISKDGFFEISVWKNGNNSTIKVRPDENGKPQYYFYSDKDPKGSSTYDQEWLEDILLESTYKLGLGAEERVAWLLKNGGVEKVFDDIAYIENNYTLGVYYKYLIEKADLSESNYLKILRGVSLNMDSDYTKAEVLITMSPKVIGNKNLLLNYVRAVKTISSDFETRRTLSNVIVDAKTDEEILNTVLEVIQEISSDYEKTELLIQISDAVMDNSNLLQGYVKAVGSVSSDYETRRALMALTYDRNMDLTVLSLILDLFQNISSDYEKSQLLTEIGPLCNNTQLREPYFKAVDYISSDYEKSRVLLVFIESDNLDKQTILELIKSIKTIGSDYQKSQLLKLMIKPCKGDKELEDSLLAAIKSVSSDYERSELLIKFYESK